MPKNYGPYCVGHPDCHSSKVAWYARIPPNWTTGYPLPPRDRWPLCASFYPYNGHDPLCKAHALIIHHTAIG